MVLPPLSALPALVLLAATPPPLCQGKQGEIRLELTVAALASDRGNVTVVVYDNPRTFLERGGRLFKARLPAKAGTVSLCLGLPRPGTYAVAVYHDADADGKFGRSWIGLPSEGWGFSNDPPRSYGVPTFAEVAFTAGSGGIRQTIHMHYP